MEGNHEDAAAIENAAPNSDGVETKMAQAEAILGGRKATNAEIQQILGEKSLDVAVTKDALTRALKRHVEDSRKESELGVKTERIHAVMSQCCQFDVEAVSAAIALGTTEQGVALLTGYLQTRCMLQLPPKIR
jgi:hypothetical protein